MSGEIVTIHGAAEGVDAFPMFCGPKLPMLAWAVGLESAHILLPGSEWTPCCRDPYARVGCICDQWGDEEDDRCRRVIVRAAERAGHPPPRGMLGLAGLIGWGDVVGHAGSTE